MSAKIYVIHDPEDDKAARELQKFLRPQINRGQIQLSGLAYAEGGYKPQDAQRDLESAEIIVLLVSMGMINECVEAIDIAMMRSQAELCVVVPVLVSKAILNEQAFQHYMSLPRGTPQRYVAQFRDQAEAWCNVAQGLLEVVGTLPQRQQARKEALSRPRDPSRRRLLFVAANPVGTSPLQLAAEAARVRTRLQQDGLSDQVDLIEHQGASAGALAAALLRHAPYAVHFSGHGGPGGAIMLEGLRREPAPMSATALRQMLSGLGAEILLLNSCFGGMAADLVELKDCVKYFIGFRTAISDREAIEFAEILHVNLARGRTVTQAFEQAQAALTDRTVAVLRAA